MEESKTTVCHLQVGDIARFRIRAYLGRFMVVDRSPEGQTPGFTKVFYEETKTEETLTWAMGNVRVEYLGKGEFVPQVVVFP